MPRSKRNSQMRTSILVVKRFEFVRIIPVHAPCSERPLIPNQPLVERAAKEEREPIVLKNYSLIVAQAADSICLLDRGICDVGTKAGGAGSTVL